VILDGKKILDISDFLKPMHCKSVKKTSFMNIDAKRMLMKDLVHLVSEKKYK
jgi:hypothetical protein